MSLHNYEFDATQLTSEIRRDMYEEAVTHRTEQVKESIKSYLTYMELGKNYSPHEIRSKKLVNTNLTAFWFLVGEGYLRLQRNMRIERTEKICIDIDNVVKKYSNR